MAGETSTGYSGPLSPEEIAECDRELEEDRRKAFKLIDRMIERRIRRYTYRGIYEEIYDHMD